MERMAKTCQKPPHSKPFHNFNIMAKIINGHLEGRVGNLVYYLNDGKQCVRTIPSKVKNPQSATQMRQRQKFAAVQQWLSPLRNYLRSYRKPNTYRQIAGINIKCATTAGEGHATVDPAKVVLAIGNLSPIVGASLKAEDGKLRLCWSDNSDLVMSNSIDRLVYLIYNPQTMHYFSNIDDSHVPHRFERNCTISLPPDVKGTYHVYASFFNVYRTECSDSTYLGEVEL